MAETKKEKGDKPEKGAKPGKTEKPAAKGAKPDAAAADAKGAKGKGRKEAGAEIAAAGAVKAAPKDYVARLKKLYRDEIVPKLTKEFGYK
ncbi:MAG: 50S ribosomal protein L5, partial [Roseiarcus sp.]